MINGFARKPDKSVEVPTDPQINCTNLIFDLTKKEMSTQLERTNWKIRSTLHLV